MQGVQAGELAMAHRVRAGLDVAGVTTATTRRSDRGDAREGRAGETWRGATKKRCPYRYLFPSHAGRLRDPATRVRDRDGGGRQLTVSNLGTPESIALLRRAGP